MKSALKPQQKLDLLKVHLILSLLHQLVFTHTMLASIKATDRVIRAFVRRWLRLTKDTNLAVFNSPFKVGGLETMIIFI